MPNGQASDCPRRRNGSMLPAADWSASGIRGEMKLPMMTPIAGNLAAGMCGQEPPPSAASHPTAMDSTIWQVTSGSGAWMNGTPASIRGARGRTRSPAVSYHLLIIISQMLQPTVSFAVGRGVTIPSSCGWRTASCSI